MGNGDGSDGGPPTTTPCWLTNLLVVAVVALIGLALVARLVDGWATVAVLTLAAVIVLGTAAAPEARGLASLLLQLVGRKHQS